MVNHWRLVTIGGWPLVVGRDWWLAIRGSWQVLGGGERGPAGMKNKEPRRRPYRDWNPQSMAWETSAGLMYYFPMWLSACLT